MNMICAFSSDSRDLYKADIYRVLSLPKDYLIHFRYKTKYVDDILLHDINKLTGRDVVIFLTTGNTKYSDKLKHIPIRLATISRSFISNTTGVFHVYMKLKNFTDASIKQSNPHDVQPPIKFFSELEISLSSNSVKWADIIDKIMYSFPKIQFIHINGIKKENGKHLEVKYSNETNTCFYKVTQGYDYYLDISIANPKSYDNNVLIEHDNSIFAINHTNPLVTSVQYDDLHIPLYIKRLSVFHQASILKFIPNYNDKEKQSIKLSEYLVNIDFKLGLNGVETIIFGLLSSLAFVALSFTKNIYPIDQCLNVIASISIIFICSAALYNWFNKK